MNIDRHSPIFPLPLVLCGRALRTGAGAPAPTDQELNSQEGKPADHQGLEEYFLTVANRHAAEAHDHVAMGHAYRGTRIAHAAVHVTVCRQRSDRGCGHAQTPGWSGSVSTNPAIRAGNVSPVRLDAYEAHG